MAQFMKEVTECRYAVCVSKGDSGGCVLFRDGKMNEQSETQFWSYLGV